MTDSAPAGPARATTRGASSTWSFTTSPTRACTRSSGESAAIPARPPRELLRALGIEPHAEGNRQVNSQDGPRRSSDELRAAVLGEPRE